MKYVDEFRNAEIARALAAEIASITDPQRHYKIMEVCGGHTHTIYRHRRVPANDGGLSLGQAVLADAVFKGKEA